MTAKFWIGVGVFVFIALAGVFYQKFPDEQHCDYDGSSIAPIYEVEIVLKDMSSRRFCSLTCAKQWFDSNKDIVDHVIVTDEIRGNKVESYLAFFVKSDLVTNESNDNCIHTFQRRSDALAHSEKFNGFPVDNPFEGDE